MSTDLSILIPVYNEEENIRILINEIRQVMGPANLHYEIIILDDGSSDRSAEEMNSLKGSWTDQKNGLCCIYLGRHLGKSDALSHGFKISQGNIIITLDGDLQDDPHEIPRFVDKIKEGYDLVSGWKSDRQDPPSKIWLSSFFNKTTSFFTGILLHDFGSGFKAYRRESISNLHLFKGSHRFIPVLIKINGFRIAEIKYHHRARCHGRSKFGALRLLEGAVCFIRVLWLFYVKKSSPKQSATGTMFPGVR